MEEYMLEKIRRMLLVVFFIVIFPALCFTEDDGWFQSLQEHGNVDKTAPLDKEGLFWDDTAQLWAPNDISTILVPFSGDFTVSDTSPSYGLKVTGDNSGFLLHANTDGSNNPWGLFQFWKGVYSGTDFSVSPGIPLWYIDSNNDINFPRGISIGGKNNIVYVNVFTDEGIQTAINSLGSDGGIVQLLKGTYTITEGAPTAAAITIAQPNITLRGTGKGTKLHVTGAASEFTRVIYVTANYVTLENFWVEADFIGTGVDLQSAADYGLEFNGVTHGTIRNCIIGQMQADAAVFDNSDYMLYENNYVYDCYNPNDKLSDTPSALDIEDGSDFVTARGNTVINCEDCIFSHAHSNALGGAPITNITVENNDCIGGDDGNTLLEVAGHANNAVNTTQLIGNRLSNSQITCDDNIQGLTIEGNIVEGVTTLNGIVVAQSTTANSGVKIKGNYVTGAQVGIRVNTDNTIVSGNYVDANGDDGINISSTADYCLVSYNTVEDNGTGGGIDEGIDIQGSYATVIGNISRDTGGGSQNTGIRLESGATGATVIGNHTSGNSDEGCQIDAVTTGYFVGYNNFAESTPITDTSTTGTLIKISGQDTIIRNNLGLGNATPWQELTVTGDGVFSDASPELAFRVSSDNTAHAFHANANGSNDPWGVFQLWGKGTDTGTGFNVGSSAANVPTWYVDNSNNMKIGNNLYVDGQALLPVFFTDHITHTVSGTTTETALATITIPANTLGRNGIIEINTLWSVSVNSANSKTARIRYSSITGTVYKTRDLANNQYMGTSAVIMNRNATNSQIGASPSGAASFSFDFVGTTILITSSVDTTAETTVVISGQLSSGANTAGETITLEAVYVKVYPN